MALAQPLRRVLLIDDNPDDRLLAARELRRAFSGLQIREAATWDQFKQALAEGETESGFDLVITDYDLRWSTGLDVLRAVKHRFSDWPVIMFTDSGSQEVAVEAMKAGLDDYVLKSPKHLVRLSQAVRTVWENAQVRRRASDLELRLKFLLNELNMGVFRTTEEGHLLEASDGLRQLLKLANIDDVQDFFRHHLPSKALDWAGQPQQNREIELTDASGGSLWLKVHATRVEVQGQPVIEGLVSDITDQKAAAIELRSLNQSLEQRVAQRTARLERLNKELELFAFSVSHDLRSPIRQIDGFASLLRQQLQALGSAPIKGHDEGHDEGHDTIGHYLERILTLTARAGQMLDDLLQFSRTGQAEMVYVPVTMTRLVQEVLRQLEPALGEQTIAWQIEPLPSVWGDRSLLRNVWQNLIENAVKYTRDRDRATIHIGSTPGDGETIFYIRDNGIGFAMAEAKNLFGLFQRLPNAAGFEGTGIGLANVQRIVHRHQGQLWAEGQPDVGATFYFSIPDGGPPDGGPEAAAFSAESASMP
ncbi:sensor histidine kinase [Nodosilinea nodulosa]|uniref:sensor histidine kinase n=1 Tax=Nodosilinea nodulosa TaxID=416001 RepID=UPI0002D61EFA|nr:hybrid sensor histidine kinase/response regulator [Nodosilinea nodulosa]